MMTIPNPAKSHTSEELWGHVKTRSIIIIAPNPAIIEGIAELNIMKTTFATVGYRFLALYARAIETAIRINHGNRNVISNTMLRRNRRIASNISNFFLPFRYE